MVAQKVSNEKHMQSRAARWSTNTFIWLVKTDSECKYRLSTQTVHSISLLNHSELSICRSASMFVSGCLCVTVRFPSKWKETSRSLSDSFSRDLKRDYRVGSSKTKPRWCLGVLPIKHLSRKRSRSSRAFVNAWILADVTKSAVRRQFGGKNGIISSFGINTE